VQCPFLLERFEFDFALLKVFDFMYVLLFGAGFSSIKNMKRGSLALYIPYIYMIFHIYIYIYIYETVCSLFDFSFNFFGVN
jgi:lipoprotein signal peptidase